MNLEQLNKELLKNKNFEREYKKKEEDFNIESDIPFEMGQRIFEARMIANMSQKELAKKLNTKQPSIARAENGSIVPTIPFLYKIAKALGTYITLPQFGCIKEKNERITTANSQDITETTKLNSPANYFIESASYAPIKTIY